MLFKKGECLDTSKPKLKLWLVDDCGTLIPIDAYSVGFRIVDVTTEEKRCHFVQQEFEKIQVYPDTGPQQINVTDLVTGDPAGEKIDVGNYFAPWVPSCDLRSGEYAIIWEWKIYGADGLRITRQNFFIGD